MKKTWFDRALFKDAFRQLSVSGMIVLLVMCIQAVLLPVGKVIVSRDVVNHGVESVFIYSLNPMVFLLFTVVTPLMAIGLFRFLSRRNECDFYHSIPQTRNCLFLSFSAAVLAWTVILQAVPTVLSIVVHLIFRSYFAIEWYAVFQASCILFAAECLVLASVLLAVTVTRSNPLAAELVQMLNAWYGHPSIPVGPSIPIPRNRRKRAPTSVAITAGRAFRTLRASRYRSPSLPR